MTAAAERAALAAIGRDLLALRGDRSERCRSAFLASPSDTQALRSASFNALAASPAWLRLPREAQRRVAARAALLAMAPTLAQSIDGEWLGELARASDEEALDWAIALAADVPEGGAPAIAAREIEGAGFDLMRGVLPPSLTGYLAWAPSRGRTIKSPALAAFCVCHAAKGLAA